MSEYAQLVKDVAGELEEFHKADAAKKEDGDDNKVKQAAKEGAAESDDGDADEDDDKEGKPFGKALTVTLPDGSSAQAFDGSKAIQTLVSENADLREQIGDLQKAFSIAVDVVKDLRASRDKQGEMLKALQTKIASVGASPSGRRTMVASAEKLTPGDDAQRLGPSAAQGPTQASVMQKAMKLAEDRTSHFGWEGIPRIEAFQNRGQLGPPDLLARFPELLT